MEFPFQAIVGRMPIGYMDEDKKRTTIIMRMRTNMRVMDRIQALLRMIITITVSVSVSAINPIRSNILKYQQQRQYQLYDIPTYISYVDSEGLICT